MFSNFSTKDLISKCPPIISKGIPFCGLIKNKEGTIIRGSDAKVKEE